VSDLPTTQLERESLEAHVDLCALRYKNLDERLDKVEEKIDIIHKDITDGQKSMTKVLIGTAGTVVAGLLSTVIVIILQM
jgi:tetrahydromethanopterin S-methyltransferase subunit G